MASITPLGPLVFNQALDDPENVSAVVVVGDYLVVGGDETDRVQILKRNGDAYDVIHDLPLNTTGDEIDIEGLTYDGTHVYVIGAHSKTRDKVKPEEKTYAQNRKALKDLDNHPERDVLCRFALGADGAPSGLVSASLRSVIDADDILKRFVPIPSKDNGVDIEGLAAHGGSVYVGFRGPVLRGVWATVLKCRFGNPVTNPELLFLTLGGLGCRDLVRVAGGFLVLAGPVGEGPPIFRVFFWDGKDCVPGTDRPAADTGKTELLGEVIPAGNAKPEGMAVLSENGNTYDVMIVSDGVTNGAPTTYRIVR